MMTETTTNSVELAEGSARPGSVLEQPPAGQRRHAGRPRPHRQRVRREPDELQRQPHDQHLRLRPLQLRRARPRRSVAHQG